MGRFRDGFNISAAGSRRYFCLAAIKTANQKRDRKKNDNGKNAKPNPFLKIKVAPNP